MSDAEQTSLLERLQAGDEQALAELAEAYRTKIYQLAFRYLRSREDAEEVTQDVLFKVYRKVGEFRGDAALSSWIYRITFNAAMSRLRTVKYQRAQAQDRQAAETLQDRDGGSRRSIRREPTSPTGARWPTRASSARSFASASSARFSRCRRSIARPSCCATSRGCRPRRRARCEVKDQTLKSRPAPRPPDPAQAARRFCRRALDASGRSTGQ
jgi:RNA polymerase sigma factor (sigma-70 family)